MNKLLVAATVLSMTFAGAAFAQAPEPTSNPHGNTPSNGPDTVRPGVNAGSNNNSMGGNGNSNAMGSGQQTSQAPNTPTGDCPQHTSNAQGANQGASQCAQGNMPTGTTHGE